MNDNPIQYSVMGNSPEGHLVGYGYGTLAEAMEKVRELRESGYTDIEIVHSDGKRELQGF
jgi:hypothetical protein